MPYKRVIIICLLLISIQTFAQQRKEYSGKGAVSEIVMPAQANIVSHFSLFYDALIPNNNGEKRSFWYKIVFEKDCFFKFNLFPTVESDRYDYKLFKVENNINFCEASSSGKIIPITGVTYKRTWNDSEQTKAFRENLVYTKSVNVKAGDAIYLEILNLWGSDLGHIIEFNTCDYTYVLKASKENSLPNNTQHLLSSKENMESELKGSISRIREVLCPPNGMPVKLSSIIFSTNGVELKNRFAFNGDIVSTPPKMEAILKAQKKLIDTHPDSNSFKVTIPKVNQPDSNLSVTNTPIKIKCLVQNSINKSTINLKPRITNEITGKELSLKQLKEGEFELIAETGVKYKIQTNQIGFKPFDETVILSSATTAGKKNYTISLTPLQTGEHFVLQSIQFHPNTLVVKAEAQKEIQSLAKFLQCNQEAVIEISGHTNGNRTIEPDKLKSNLGGDWYFKGSSKKLSLERAKKVQDELIRLGIKEVQIKIKGYGGDKPLFPEPQSQEEINKNIRVEVLILKT